LGKYIANAEIYRPNTQDPSIQGLYETKSNETICFVKKIFMNHYSMLNLPHSFMIPFKHTWDIHQVKFPSNKLKFSALAESKVCPEIIELNENIFGVGFNVDNRYEETKIILKNFILHQLGRIREG
jgi:GMP synthase-like glutamine amidotransferase